MKAFPNQEVDAYGSTTEKGMDLRDYLAAKAMQGMAANPADDYDIEKETYDEYLENIARISYKMADKMMEARKNES